MYDIEYPNAQFRGLCQEIRAVISWGTSRNVIEHEP